MNEAPVGASGPTLTLEYLDDETVSEIVNGASLANFATSLASTLHGPDHARTRIVLTGDLVSSVNSRQDRSGNEYTLERGAGIVAAKTMPPDTDGVVDILVPSDWLLPLDDGSALNDRDQLLRHLVAHEAVHAQLFHDGNEPFHVYKRRKYGDAQLTFMSMACYQVEEHLAEYTSNQVVRAPWSTTAEQIVVSFTAWNSILSGRLPALSEDDPDYFSKAMMITLTALHDLWKALSYFAAELRSGNSFSVIPEEIAELTDWKNEVAPWWDDYISLLSQIPMSTPVDVARTDDVVEAIGLLLQRWAKGVGVHHHDTPEGPWFQMTRIM